MKTKKTKINNEKCKIVKKKEPNKTGTEYIKQKMVESQNEKP